MSDELKDGQGAGAEPRAERAASGLPPAPLLDNECRNLPKPNRYAQWTRKQWVTRRAVLDQLQFWQGSGYQVLWVTLTSSASSSAEKLRSHFQVLRKRCGRELGFAPVEYVCVDTREGHGVLHMLWAWRDPDASRRSSFYVPHAWLQKNWLEIHGAFHVNVKRVGGSGTDARRLSRYIVSQYCGGQSALVRVSGSRRGMPFRKMRVALRALFRDLPERHEYNNRALAILPTVASVLAIGADLLPLLRYGEATRAALAKIYVFWRRESFCRGFLGLELREAWESLIRTGGFEPLGYGRDGRKTRLRFVWADDCFKRC